MIWVLYPSQLYLSFVSMISLVFISIYSSYLLQKCVSKQSLLDIFSKNMSGIKKNAKQFVGDTNKQLELL